MTNKYLEKVAALSEEEINSKLARQAAVNTIRSDLLGPPIGPVLNAVYSPGTLEEIRRGTDSPNVKRRGDWAVPALSGAVGTGVGLTLGNALRKAIHRRYLVSPGTAVALGIVPAITGVWGSMIGTEEGLRHQVKDSLRKAQQELSENE